MGQIYFDKYFDKNPYLFVLLHINFCQSYSILQIVLSYYGALFPSIDLGPFSVFCSE